MKKKICLYLCFLFFIFLIDCPKTIFAKETDDSSIAITDGETEYGEIYGSTYGEDDDSRWLTVKLKERGLRVIDSEGKDLLLIDQFGGIYINGQLVELNANTNSVEPVNEKQRETTVSFLYLLLIINLAVCFILYLKIQKIQEKMTADLSAINSGEISI